MTTNIYVKRQNQEQQNFLKDIKKTKDMYIRIYYNHQDFAIV